MSLFNVINHEVTLGAKKRVKQQKELGPCMTESYVDTTRGSAIHGGSQLSEALKDLKKPIVDDEAEDVRCIGLIREAKFYTSRKLHSSAKDALMKAHKLCPNDQMVITRLSQCLLKCGQYPDALIVANTGLNKDSGSYELLNAKAQALYDMSAFEYSLVYFSRAAGVSPTNAQAAKGIKKCMKTIKSAVPKNTFSFYKSEKFINYLATIGYKATQVFLTEEPQDEDEVLLDFKYCNNLNKDQKLNTRKTDAEKYLKLIEDDKQFFKKLGKHFQLETNHEMTSKSITNVDKLIRDSEDFLQKRLEFWSHM